MKAALAAVVGLVIGIGGAVAYYSSSRAALAPPGKAGNPKDRNTVIVLYQDGNDCKALKEEPLRVLKNDRVKLAVYNFCLDKFSAVRIRFTSSNDAHYPSPGTGKLQDNFNPPPNSGSSKFQTAALSVDVAIDDAATPPASDGAWLYDYVIEVQRDGETTWTTLVDPKFEVDPWSS